MKGTATKCIFFELLLVLVYFQASVLARANQDSGRTELQHSHKEKRSWDSTYADPIDEPVVPEPETGNTDVEVNDEPEPSTPNVWVSIGKDFVTNRKLTMNTDGGLECDAVGSPPPKVFWLKNGSPIESELIRQRMDMGNSVLYDKFDYTGMANVKSILPIKCAQPQDEGQYTCIAINGAGKQATATTYLSVIAEDTNVPRGSCEYRMSMFSYKKTKKGSTPFVVNYETFHMETMGRFVSLPCKVTGKPRPQLTWLDADGQKIVPGKKYQLNSSGTLVIRNLKWSDMGVYTCFVENHFGFTNVTTFVYPMAESTER